LALVTFWPAIVHLIVPFLTSLNCGAHLCPAEDRRLSLLCTSVCVS